MKAGTKTGLKHLKQYLQANPTNFAQMDLDSFRVWLLQQIAAKENDPIFVLRCKIRDLQKANWETWRQLQHQLNETEYHWLNCSNYQRIKNLEHRIIGLQKAVAGLQQAVLNCPDHKKEDMVLKLGNYERELSACSMEQQTLIRNTPEQQTWLQAQKEFEAFGQHIGIPALEAQLQQLNQQQGQNATEAGSKFEKTVAEIVEKYIVKLVHPNSAYPVNILSQVTLGCARSELDYVIVQAPKEEEPVQILAIVEVKRNPNDIAGGFFIRQENLAWFTRDSQGYDPQQYRTREFLDGHFDRPAYHHQNRQSFMFTAESFQNFTRSKNQYFMDRLFFITQQRRLYGLNSDEYSRLMYRVSSDIFFDIDNSICLSQLFDWTQNMRAPLQSIHVLEMFARQLFAKQIFLIERG